MDFYPFGDKPYLISGSDDMTVKDTDLPVIKNCFAYRMDSFKNWLVKLQSDKLDTFKAIIKTYKGSPDKIPLQASLLLPEMIALEACFHE